MHVYVYVCGCGCVTIISNCSSISSISVFIDTPPVSIISFPFIHSLILSHFQMSITHLQFDTTKMGDAVTRLEKIVEDSVGPSPPIGPRTDQTPVLLPQPLPLPSSPSKGKGGREGGEGRMEKERKREKEGSVCGSRTGSGISTRLSIDRVRERVEERVGERGVVVISSEALSQYKVLTVGKYHPFVAPTSSTSSAAPAATASGKDRQKEIDREREKEKENESNNTNNKEVENKVEDRIDRMLKFGGDGSSSERERARDRDKDRGGMVVFMFSAVQCSAV